MQPFEFVNNVVTGNNNYLSVQDTTFILSQDFVPLGFSSNDELTANVAFAGFGFAIDDSIKWNDYDSLTVEGKWALILRGGPDDDLRNSPYASHLPLRKKVLVAQDNNAAGVLFVSQYDDSEEELIPLKYDNSFSGASIPVVHIRQLVAENIFSYSDLSL